jgi:hypothetical protein
LAPTCAPDESRYSQESKRRYPKNQNTSEATLPAAVELEFRGGWVREYHIRCWSLIWYNLIIMQRARKITVEVPSDLLENAQRASGAGITQTVRTGLQLVAASRTYARLRQLRGKVRFSRTVAELKADR